MCDCPKIISFLSNRFSLSSETEELSAHVNIDVYVFENMIRQHTKSKYNPNIKNEN